MGLAELLLAAALLRHGAHAWILAGSNADFSTIYYADMQTVKRRGSIADAWLLQINRSPRAFSGRNSYRSVSKVQFDCDARTIAIQFSANYAENGDAIYSSPSLGAVIPILPETTLEMGINMICDGKLLRPDFKAYESMDDATAYIRKQVWHQPATMP